MRVDALVDDSRSILGLSRALGRASGSGPNCRLTFLGNWGELRARASDGSFDLAFFAPDFGPQGLRLDEVARLVELCGVEVVIPVVNGAPTKVAGGLHSLGPFRFPFLIVKGADDEPDSLRRLVARARNRSFLKELLGGLGDGVGRETNDLILFASAGWPPLCNVAQLARELCESPRTIRRRLEMVPVSPSRLLRWGCLLDALRLWEMGLHSRARIIPVLGLSDVPALAHLAKSLTGEPLTRVLSPSGEEVLRDALLEDLGT